VSNIVCWIHKALFTFPSCMYRETYSVVDLSLQMSL